MDNLRESSYLALAAVYNYAKTRLTKWLGFNYPLKYEIIAAFNRKFIYQINATIIKIQTS